MNKTDLQLYLADLMGWNGKKMLDGRVTIKDKFSNAVIASQVINGNVVGEVIASRIEMPDLTWDLLIPIATIERGFGVSFCHSSLIFYGYFTGGKYYDKTPEGLAEALIDEFGADWEHDATETFRCDVCGYTKLSPYECNC